MLTALTMNRLNSEPRDQVTNLVPRFAVDEHTHPTADGSTRGSPYTVPRVSRYARHAERDAPVVSESVSLR